MTIRIHEQPCVEVSCDDCEDECWEDGKPHWFSVDDARDWLNKHADGWLFTDSDQLCPRCHRKRVCNAEGHDWEDWRQSAADALEVFRFCDRCSAVDYTVRTDATP